MAAHLRWRFVDPRGARSPLVFYPNPNRMSSPHPERVISSEVTSGVDGRVFVWEGPSRPVEWTFGGSIFDPTFYEALRSWVYDVGHRIYVYDHFGRRLEVVLKKFTPEGPARPRGGKYWYHTYEISATVFAMSAPTVGQVAQ